MRTLGRGRRRRLGRTKACNIVGVIGIWADEWRMGFGMLGLAACEMGDIDEQERLRMDGQR